MMKNNFRKVMVKGLLGAAVVCATTALVQNTEQQYKADASVVDTGVFEMVNGASLKISPEGGIRFRAKFDETVKAEIDKTDVDIYFVISSKAVFESVTENNYKDLSPAINGQVDEAKIYKDGDYYYVNGVVKNIDAANREIDYTAVVYITDGTSVRYADVKDVNSEDVYKVGEAGYTLDTVKADLYSLVNYAILDSENDYVDDILSSEAYTWFGTKNYPVVLNSNDDYDALYTKINEGKELSEKYVNVNNDATPTVVLASGKTAPTVVYTIEFYNGTTLVSAQKLVAGETVEVPENPVKEADATFTYVFDKWSSEVATTANGNARYDAEFKVAGKKVNVTLQKYVDGVASGNPVEESVALPVGVVDYYDVAKQLGVNLTDNDIVFACDTAQFEVTESTAEIAVNLYGITRNDLAGVYTFDTDTFCFNMDGTVTFGNKNGQYYLAMDSELKAPSLVVALDSVANSYRLKVVKADNEFTGYNLVNDSETFTCTASVASKVYDYLKGKKFTGRSWYDPTSTLSDIKKSINGQTEDCWASYIRFKDDKTASWYGGATSGSITIKAISDTYGTIKGAQSDNLDGYYVKIDGKYYIFTKAKGPEGMQFYCQYGEDIDGQVQYFDEGAIINKLAGHYENSTKLNLDLTAEKYGASDHKMLSLCGMAKLGTNKKISNDTLGDCWDIVPTSETTGLIFFAATSGYVFATFSYDISGDDVVICENKVYGVTAIKGGGSTEFSAYYKDKLAGNFFGNSGYTLTVDNEGGATLYKDSEAVETLTYVITPGRSYNEGLNVNSSLYKGTIEFDFADGSRITVNYDYTCGFFRFADFYYQNEKVVFAKV